MCEYDYRTYDDEPTREEMIRELVGDCDSISDLRHLVREMRAELKLQNAWRKAQRQRRASTPPEPPAPFISIHTRNFTTGEDLGTVVVMQDRPKGEGK